MSTASTRPCEEEWKSPIRSSHLSQLRQFKEPRQPPKDEPDAKVPFKQELLNWIKAANPQITQAINRQVYGGQTPLYWPNSVLSFLESAATYLRDDNEVAKAIQSARNGDDEQALVHLLKSEEAIKEVAAAMGLDYITICDLPDQSPIGHWPISGPFCGAFFPPNTSDRPFFGVAFKGTKFTSPSQWFTDWRRALVSIEGNIIPNALVSEGVNYSLLTPYGSPDPGIPQDFIKTAIQQYITQTTSKPAIHVTGHSLGGSYATLSYGALLAKPVSAAPDSYVMGDLYTFAAPRIGNDAFAIYVNSMTPKWSTTWRFVNDLDPVPTLPPMSYDGWFPDPTNFYHINTGYQIFATQAPSQYPSEEGLSPGPPVTDVNAETIEQMVQYHVVEPYWQSLCFANNIPYTPNPSFKSDLDGVLSSFDEAEFKKAFDEIKNSH